MNSGPELKLWLRKMGYCGQCPKDWSNICNTSTNFIWEQIIKNVHPKQHVQKIKSNIILERLKNASNLPNGNQVDILHEIPEIDHYKYKLYLENEKERLEKAVKEKKAKLEALSKKNKIKRGVTAFVKDEINELKERHFLLDKKKIQLDTQNCKENDTLIKLKALKPNDEDKTFTEMITEVLTETTELLTEDLIRNKNVGTEEIFNRKPLRKLNTFSTENSNFNYLSMLEKNDKNRGDTRGQQLSTLLNTEESSKSNITIIKSNAGKRESLGLLPDGFLDQSEFCNDDSFLTHIPESSNNANTKLQNEINNTVLFQIPEGKLKQNSKIDVTPNKSVIALVETLLHSTNREQINEILKDRMENINSSIIQLILKAQKTCDTSMDDFDLAKLRSSHIKTEIKINQLQQDVEQLNKNVAQKKIEILTRNYGSEKISEKLLNIQIKNVSLDYMTEALEININSIKMDKKSTLELDKLQSEIDKKKTEIISSINHSQALYECMKNISISLINWKENFSNIFRKFKILKYDLYENLCNCLHRNVFLEEIQIFNKFPIRYYKSCNNDSDSNKVFQRDLNFKSFLRSISISLKDLETLIELLDYSYDESELDLFLNHLKKLKILQTLNSSFKSNNDLTNTKALLNQYSLKEFEENNDYIDKAINEFEKFIRPDEFNKLLLLNENLKESVNIWLELPMKVTLSENKLVEGKPYQYYRDKLKELAE